jgi:hypothetical protein
MPMNHGSTESDYVTVRSLVLMNLEITGSSATVYESLR